MTTPFQISAELLPSTAHVPSFCTEGLGSILGLGVSNSLLSNRNQFPFLRRGKTLLIIGDFGGQHQKQCFETYTFLILDIAKNHQWLSWQNHFRNDLLPTRRRMSFKTLNDGMRRRALVPFMRAAAGIEGCLVQFAVSKNGESLFAGAPEDDIGSDLLKHWKPSVQERLLRILHFSAFLLSGFSAPGQDIVWIIDNDDVAANVPLLTNLTALFARVLSSYCPHALGHIRCGTTGTTDGGRLAIEDLAAIADLTTGALGELCTGLVVEDLFPRKGLVTPLPTNLTWKTRLIASWMAAHGFRIRRHTSVLELCPGSTRSRVSTLGWRMYEDSIVQP